MQVIIKKFKGDQLKEGCDIALKHRLYVSGWQLSRVLKSIRRKTEQDSEVVICYHEEIPIGVAITHQLRTMAFIRKAHRRKRIGTQLVKALTKVGQIDEGITGSYSFWDQIKLQDKG